MADSYPDKAKAEELDGPLVKLKVCEGHKVLRNGRFLEAGDEFETHQVSADSLIEEGQAEKAGGRSRK